MAPRRKDPRTKAQRLLAAADAIPGKHAGTTNAKEIRAKALELGAATAKTRDRREGSTK